VYPNTGWCHRLARQPIARLRENAAVVFRAPVLISPNRQRLTYLAGEAAKVCNFVRRFCAISLTPPLTSASYPRATGEKYRILLPFHEA